LYVYDPTTITVGAGLPAMLFATSKPFPIAHQLVTERPSVAQNHAQVTKASPHKNPPQKISSTPEPLFQALSSHFRIFLECSSNKLAA
jgi:hypothetical protein